MIDKRTRIEVDGLAERLRDDRLEGEDAERLREIIRHRPAARRYLVEHLYLSADLKQELMSWSKEPSETVPVSQSKILRYGAMALAISAAIALLVVAPWKSGPEGLVERTPDEEPNSLDSSAGGIAVVSATSEVIWGNATDLSLERLAGGQPIGKGVLEIASGVLQIDFYLGATMILEGPAKIELISPSHTRLAYGKLRASVLPAAQGFRVDGEQFDVVDLGTEFGMSIVEGGPSEVHVFKGEVEVLPAAKGEHRDQLLNTGEAIHFGTDGRSKMLEARSEEFSASESLIAYDQDKFDQWEAFHDELLEDPDLVVAYTFSRRSPWERTLKNQVTPDSSEGDGAIVGCEWGQGRWSGKSSLEYANPSHRVRMSLPGRFDDLTLACWIRVDRFSRYDGGSDVALLHPETQQDRYIHWTLGRTDEGQLHLHFSEGLKSEPQARNHYHCDADLFRNGLSLGEWVHLAVTYDSGNREVAHYLNGKRLDVRNEGQAHIDEVRPLVIGTADLGNWPYHEWAKGTEHEVRNLIGAVDEFLIFKRACSAEELSEIWKAGQP